MSMRLIQGNPNPKALTLSLVGQAAQPLRISIPRLNKNASEISPLAAQIFKEFGLISRIDLFEQNGEQGITLSGKVLEWNKDPKMIEKVARRIWDLLPELPIVNIDAAKKYLPMMHFFKAGDDPLFNHVKDVFEGAVRPKLAKDGGDAEVLNIQVDANTGRIDIQAVMIGSCGGCPVSKTTTLADTISDINTSFVPIKQANPDVAFVQKLYVGNIESVPADNGLILAMR